MLYEVITREEFKRLGVMGEWENPYLTMNYAYEATIARECNNFALEGSLFRSISNNRWLGRNNLKVLFYVIYMLLNGK